jgi:hypothetical protein
VQVTRADRQRQARGAAGGRGVLREGHEHLADAAAALAQARAHERRDVAPHHAREAGGEWRPEEPQARLETARARLRPFGGVLDPEDVELVGPDSDASHSRSRDTREGKSYHR